MINLSFYLFQFNVNVFDTGRRFGVAIVTIRVDRDEPPVFRNEPYRFTVSETAQINTEMFTVLAEDPDLVV